MVKMDKFVKKASEYKDVLEELKVKVDEILSPMSGADVLLLFECLDALKDGKLSAECFNKFRLLDNSGSCWRRIKEALIVADYKKQQNEKH
jgi:hypothetical protein